LFNEIIPISFILTLDKNVKESICFVTLPNFSLSIAYFMNQFLILSFRLIEVLNIKLLVDAFKQPLQLLSIQTVPYIHEQVLDGLEEHDLERDMRPPKGLLVYQQVCDVLFELREEQVGLSEFL